jgi:mono/diheme cytochrome c family protein
MVGIAGAGAVVAGAPEELPAPAAKRVEFETDVRPILQQSCLSCHARGKYKGGLSLETRESLLKGGEEGPAAVVGNSAESSLVRLAAGLEEDRRMPQKGKALTPEQIGILRAWIDQGLSWPKSVSFGFRRAPLAPRRPTVPESPSGLALDNPIDRFVARSAATHKGSLDWTPVSDRVYARRVYLDLVGLLPTPDQLSDFERDSRPDRRARLAAKLLDDRRAYAEHWLSFWNDALRNAYRGTGFIDGGRKSLTEWLFRALYENRPYDRFAHDLVSPPAGSGAEGFTKGIVWRGVVNASQAPPVQAAQNLSQVFLGTNLKCASCHDSFVNYWKLTDAYALASVFADKPLEIHRCDKPTGKTSTIGFVYPELGDVDDHAPKARRMEQLADLLVKPENGRFGRTIVNRLWAGLFGRGLVEPLDDMDQEPWDQDLLDWLAADFVEHGHDLKHTLALIVTSRSYQLPSADAPSPGTQGPYAFAGPLVRRMSAEQFADALSIVTGVWPEATGEMIKIDGRGQGGQLASVRAVIAASGKSKGPDRPNLDAKWLWSHADAIRDPGGRILLRKVVTLDKVPERAVAVAACDNEMILYVNGHRVAESADWTKPVVADVTKWLAPGENVIAAEATNWPDKAHGKGLQSAGPNPAGFEAGVVGFVGGKQAWAVGTDATWLWAREARDGWKRQPFDAAGWSHAVELPAAGQVYGMVNLETALLPSMSAGTEGPLRAALEFDDPLLAALGRTNREQVVTRRESIATTLQALELINGSTLDARLRAGARYVLRATGDRPSPEAVVRRVFVSALGRDPKTAELTPALDLVGRPATTEGVQDLLWAVVMLPEFQLID